MDAYPKPQLLNSRISTLNDLQTKWSWWNQVKNIGDVTTLILNDAYELNQRPCRLGAHTLCEDNLKCVKPIFNSRSHHPEKRLPVGLLNPSNFCYGNAVLQMWFFNERFRSSIYQWHEQGLSSWDQVLSLKLVFAELQTSRTTVDPTPLAINLGIDVKVQQDCHEFITVVAQKMQSTFFDSLMDKEFGVHAYYKIKCPSCDTAKIFYDKTHDLCVNIPLGRDTKLEEVLDDSLKRDLEFAVCDKCRTKYSPDIAPTEFEKLPPTLIIQLHRTYHEK